MDAQSITHKFKHPHTRDGPPRGETIQHKGTNFLHIFCMEGTGIAEFGSGAVPWLRRIALTQLRGETATEQHAEERRSGGSPPARARRFRHSLPPSPTPPADTTDNTMGVFGSPGHLLIPICSQPSRVQLSCVEIFQCVW
jgi:hypothetical protein